ncbi:hypothetical protein T4B_14750 [Trichinella pseudospiralis]|uniref:Uncharacterized protein n=1 Tax=Trichinella pseudospiralis TaxID=6337 RepID=A0A0V1GIK4_TRIPS|nr:hypothetical protein T4B_14750 [Trichinella pseudospiralis]
MCEAKKIQFFRTPWGVRSRRCSFHEKTGRQPTLVDFPKKVGI